MDEKRGAKTEIVMLVIVLALFVMAAKLCVECWADGDEDNIDDYVVKILTRNKEAYIDSFPEVAGCRGKNSTCCIIENFGYLGCRELHDTRDTDEGGNIKRQCEKGILYSAADIEGRTYYFCELDEKESLTQEGYAGKNEGQGSKKAMVCHPKTSSCDGNKVIECTEDGTGERIKYICSEDQYCRDYGNMASCTLKENMYAISCGTQYCYCHVSGGGKYKNISNCRTDAENKTKLLRRYQLEMI